MQQGINQSREAKSSNNFQINSIGIFEINAVSYLILEPHYQTYTHCWHTRHSTSLLLSLVSLQKYINEKMKSFGKHYLKEQCGKKYKCYCCYNDNYTSHIITKRKKEETIEYQIVWPSIAYSVEPSRIYIRIVMDSKYNTKYYIICNICA